VIGVPLAGKSLARRDRAFLQDPEQRRMMTEIPSGIHDHIRESLDMTPEMMEIPSSMLRNVDQVEQQLGFRDNHERGRL
jgi:hypothetical protein